MKLAAGVLTHNVYDHDRAGMLRRTLASLADCPRLYIVSNGSSDGTEEMVKRMGGVVVDDPVSTCGHGMNVVCRILASSGADICVFSNDDIVWKPEWMQTLRRFWEAAPADVVLASGLLEDEYPWNTVRAKVSYGGVPALIRDTAPGAAWTFRAKDWDKIGPVPEAAGWDDVPTCERLGFKGFKVAQLDLAEHIGQDKSTWGNISEKFRQPLDERWKLTS